MAKTSAQLDAEIAEALREGAMTKHVLVETNYCASMYEHRPLNGKYRCTAAGRYVDTDGRVICARCAAGLVVVKLADVGRLVALVDRLADLKVPQMTDDLRRQLRALVGRTPEASP